MEILILSVLLIIVLSAVAYEYRLRKPDQIILSESKGALGYRTGRFYPRHFSLPISAVTHSFVLTVEASAKGNLDIRVKLAVTVAAVREQIPALIRVGGWRTDAVSRAAKELEVALYGFVKEYTEKYGIEELSSEQIHQYLQEKVVFSKVAFGLEILTLAVQSFEPASAQISEALRQREHARILEQTETLNQQARIAAARARLRADEEINLLEHELELKKIELKKSQMEKESEIATARVEDDLERNTMRLEFEKKELELLKHNPELLLLTPQAARLAEASQNLKNARTVVSFSPNDAAQGSEILGMFQSILHQALSHYQNKKERKRPRE